jgi:ACT domain-containing protein
VETQELEKRKRPLVGLDVSREAFFQEKFNDVFAGFDANLKDQLSEDRLQSFFMQVTDASGHFDHVIWGVNNRDLDIVDVLCQVQGGKAIVRVAYDSDMKVNGFAIVPGK